MDAEQAAQEIRRLERCVNNLVAVLALPATWRGDDPTHVASTLLDVLPQLVRLDVVCVRLLPPVVAAELRADRIIDPELMASGGRMVASLDELLGADTTRWPALQPMRREGLTVVCVPIGLRGELGVIVAGARGRDFPDRTEKVLLVVASNQAAIGLQAARFLRQERRVATELEERVAERTAALATANHELRREITARMLVQARLQQEQCELARSEAFLAESQRLSATGSFWWKVTTNELTFSDEAHRILKLEPSPTITVEQLLDVVHPEDLGSLKEHLDRARTAGHDVELDLRLRRPEDCICHVHLVAKSRRDDSGALEYIGAIQDVTARRLSEEALGKARSELAQVSRVTSLGVMAASIAHEVNQPLSGIVTNAGTCLRMLLADPPNLEGARETTRRITRDGHRAADVVSRLRSLFEKKDRMTEAVNLNDATREVAALSRGELQRGRVVLRLDLADDLPKVEGDRIQLQQVILNLLLNACAAMNALGDRPRRLDIRTERQGDCVRISVRDNGAGLPDEPVERLFEAFYTTKPSGMGIGLSVSRAIIESHGGRLSAAPNDGAGATFSFSLPCMSAATAEPP